MVERLLAKEKVAGSSPVRRSTYTLCGPDNIDRRLDEHRKGLVKSTRNKVNRLLYTEKYSDKQDAWKREKWLKSGIGGSWVNKNIMGR